MILHGVIYLHRITDRMDANLTRSFKLFKKIFGKNTFKNVVIVTTGWHMITEEEGEWREGELRANEVFKELQGLARHNNTIESAQKILRTIFLNRSMPPTRIDEGKGLGGPITSEEIANHGVVTIA
jgi:hypothetical protein